MIINFTMFDDCKDYVNEKTEYLYDYLKKLDHTHYDKNKYIDEYRELYLAKLETFFNIEFGKAFEFADYKALEEESTYQLNQQKKDFLQDIYAYASFVDFRNFNHYKESAGADGKALNCLSKIPNDFHLRLYEDYKELFGDLLYSEIESKVEELFFELHNEVYNHFKTEISMLDDTLPLFRPECVEELEVLLKHFDASLINMKDIVKAEYDTDISLLEKNEYLRLYLQKEVFDGIHITDNSQQAYDENSLIFDEPCIQDYVLKAKEALEILDYEVAIFELKKDKDFYIFAYAKNEKDLKDAFDYINKEDAYRFDSKKSTKDYLTLYSKDKEEEIQSLTKNHKRTF